MSTKQTLFASLASILLLSACSGDELLVNEPKAPRTPIGFSVTANRATRAAAVYTASNLPTEFRLAAWYKANSSDAGKVYIKSDKIKQNGSVYENVTDLRYWPSTADETLDFFAHNAGDAANFSLTDESGNLAPTLTDIEFDNDPTKHVDILYATAFDQKKTSSSTVDIQFKHALSQVTFAAKNVSRHIRVEIEKVAICNVSTNKATFTFPTSASGTGSWTNATGATSQTFTVDLTGNTKTLEERGADTEVSSISPTSLTDDNHAMMLVPGTYNTATTTSFNATSETGAYVKLTCKVWNIADPTSGYQSTDVCIHDGDLYIPMAFTWEAGKKYNYNISFGTGTAGFKADGSATLVIVELNPTVENWTSGTTSDQEI